jgi:hypothetical protein
MPLVHLGTWHISDLYSQRLVRLFCYANFSCESGLNFDLDHPSVLDTRLIEYGHLKTPYQTRVGYVYPPPAECRQIPSVYACRPAPPLQAAQAPSIPRTPSLHSDRPRPGPACRFSPTWRFTSHGRFCTAACRKCEWYVGLNPMQICTPWHRWKDTIINNRHLTAQQALYNFVQYMYKYCKLNPNNHH